MSGGDLAAEATRIFEELDENCSGSLEGKEVLALAEWVCASFDGRNRDITKEQMQSRAVKIKKACDKNGDGSIEKGEFLDYYKRLLGAVSGEPIGGTAAASSSGAALMGAEPESEELMDVLTEVTSLLDQPRDTSTDVSTYKTREAVMHVHDVLADFPIERRRRIIDQMCHDLLLHEDSEHMRQVVATLEPLRTSDDVKWIPIEEHAGERHGEVEQLDVDIADIRAEVNALPAGILREKAALALAEAECRRAPFTS